MALPNLRAIFASSRTALDERHISRKSFTNFILWSISCTLIAFTAAKYFNDKRILK